MTGHSIPLWLPVLLPITVGAVGYFVPTSVYKHLLIAVQVTLVALAALVLSAVRSSGELSHTVAGWPAPAGIVLRADGVSAPLVLLVTVVFLLLFLFNYRKLYMDNLFQFLFVSLEGVMISIFLTRDVFNVYVLTELTTIIATVLIVYKRNKPSLYNGMVYMTYSILAMTFFLLGIGLTYRTFGVLDFALLAERVASLDSPGPAVLPYALMMTGVGMKAGLLPMFGWLPLAHAAPSAPSMVSAMLSGLQVKTGLYLFIRFQAVFGEALATDGFFLALGLLTAVTGFLLAICQRDIKLILAFSTVSQVGLITVGLASGSAIGFWGGIYHIVNHALFKAVLFLTAGLIAKEYHTRDVTAIRGALRRLPAASVAAIAAVLGMVGAPFFNGSISKYLIESAFAADTRWQFAIYLLNFGTMLTFVRYATIFFGRATVPGAPAAAPATPDATAGDGASEAAPRDRWTAAVALVFGVAVLAGGIGAAPAMAALFPPGLSLPVGGARASGKLLAFALTAAAAVLGYRFGLRRLAFLDRVREIAVSFNTMAVLMTAFLGVLLVYLLVTV